MAIFSQDSQEYVSLLDEIRKIGSIVEDTPTGPIFRLDNPIKTKAGGLYIIKIRKPNKNRLQRGDGDFRVDNYKAFKEKTSFR